MPKIRPGQISSGGASVGDVLTWDGSAWVPMAPGGTPPDVLHSAHNNVGSGTSLPITVTAPTSGDLLVAAFNISQFGSSRDLTVPTGWTAIDSGGQVNADCRLRVIARVADGTEGTTLTFSFTGTAQTHSGCVIEVEHTNGVISDFSIANASSTSLSATNTGDLPLAFFIQNDGTSDGNTTNTVATSGWSTDVNEAPSFHALIAGHGPLTTSGGSVAPTAAWGGTVASPIAAIAVVHA